MNPESGRVPLHKIADLSYVTTKLDMPQQVDNICEANNIDGDYRAEMNQIKGTKALSDGEG
jgi:hypothetical protein